MVWINRLLWALLAAAVIAWVPRGFSDGEASHDLARVELERAELMAGNATLREEIQVLSAEVDALHVSPDDPRAQARAADEIQRIAREDLNLIREGEVVFELLGPGSTE